MKITEIQKGKGKLYEITLEDESRFWLHADLLQSEFLHTGDDLTPERIAELRQRAAEHRAHRAISCASTGISSRRRRRTPTDRARRRPASSCGEGFTPLKRSR